MATTVNRSVHSLKVVMLDSECRYTNWTRDITASDLTWDFIRLDSRESLFTHIDNQVCDAIIMPCSMRAQVDIELMTQVAKIQPAAVRVFIGAEYWNVTQKARAVDVAHRIYPSSVNIEGVGESLEYQIKLLKLLNRNTLQTYVSTVGCLPTPPSVYRQLTNAIHSDVASLQEIGDIIEQDPAAVAQIMKQVNSSFFGLERTIVDLKEAISLLGVRNLRSLALSSQLNNQFQSPSDWTIFSFEQIGVRSLMVARLAQTICRRAGVSKVMQDQAFLAGLLHDLGVLIMSSHDPEKYKKLLGYAVKKKKPVYLVEKAAFGFFHGEVAGALLALWNLPPKVVEAVMLHHVPHLSKDHEFSVLTAVHVADSMVPSIKINVGGECAFSSHLSLPYLDQVGMVDDVPQWRILANEYRIRMTSTS